MSQMATDMDPLSSYEYPSYDNYNCQVPPSMPGCNYDVKLEQPTSVNPEFYSIFNALQQEMQNHQQVLTNLNNKKTEPNPINPVPQKEEVKFNIKSEEKKQKKQLKGRTSKYWSEKIKDDNFKFYGCSVCNISYGTLHELDQHVTVHKDRVTSYDLKIKNLIKRKKLKKEKKKMKKLSKIKTEEPLEFEIKPEDGYIGNEKTSEYMNHNNENQPADQKDVKPITNENECKDKVENCVGIPETDNQSLLNLQKIYKCFACQKQFTLSYYLKLHVRSHTDEKPYTCSVCGQSFITASKLGRHNKRIHLAIRHQCRICYRFFTKFENLTTHFDKKHYEDKLEGEPYDYNAILPYLKELEEELREKAEKAEKERAKVNDPWGTWGANPGDEGILIPKVEIQETTKIEPSSVVIEEVKLDPPDVEIKIEPVEIVETKEDPPDDPVKSEDENEDDVKDERYSDDDYFPSNTWAVSPKLEDAPPSPKTRGAKNTGPLKCTVCEKTLSTASYLRVHMRTHTGERPFKCYICNRGFITSSKMHRHVLTHEETWQGDGVDLKTEDIKVDPEAEADETIKTKKRIKKAKAQFNKKSKGEKIKKYKSRPHSCEYCQKKFLHLETLQVHKKCHEGEQLVLKCAFCLEVMSDEAALKQHEPTHVGPRPYLCTICGRTYKKRETMVYHRKYHKPDKEFQCNVCSKSFNAACKLQRHLVSHRADKFVLRYECPVCAHMFHTKYHVQMHLATHQKEGLIVEENRNQILAMVLQNARKIPKQPDGATNVTDLIPSDERSRVCNICGEVFQHFYYLEEHLKGHASKITIEELEKQEEKKHVCQVCNKSFKLHYYLKLHSFTHTKEKPYICQQCGKGFITKGKLKRHLETHTGLKKYQCHICYKYFTRTSYLRIHVRTIHGTQDYNFRLQKVYNANMQSLCQ
ncbi:unnamed protein product [Diatraea saccharalis]|uniref:C2H2-type domain-containing protein n=1 Tax=Diatraea saccharalis TaxID=40085 RepID=A0A9P0C696_9NEOP|nr:unnamed protein product [Diatraea saccharalis]